MTVLLIVLLFWLAMLACFVAAYGLRPGRRAPGDPWPWWVWAATGIATLIMGVAIPLIALTSSGD